MYSCIRRFVNLVFLLIAQNQIWGWEAHFQHRRKVNNGSEWMEKLSLLQGCRDVDLSLQSSVPLPPSSQLSRLFCGCFLTQLKEAAQFHKLVLCQVLNTYQVTAYLFGGEGTTRTSHPQVQWQVHTCWILEYFDMQECSWQHTFTHCFNWSQQKNNTKNVHNWIQMCICGQSSDERKTSILHLQYSFYPETHLLTYGYS